MPLVAFEMINEDGAAVSCMVHMPTVTHLEKGQQGNLIIHVMSGRVIVTTTSYDDFVTKMQGRSSVLVPVR